MAPRDSTRDGRDRFGNSADGSRAPTDPGRTRENEVRPTAHPVRPRRGVEAKVPRRVADVPAGAHTPLRGQGPWRPGANEAAQPRSPRCAGLPTLGPSKRWENRARPAAAPCCEPTPQRPTRQAELSSEAPRLA